MNKVRGSSYALMGLFLIMGLLFGTLNFLTPLLHDDLAYLYKFGMKAEVRPTNVPVKNISDVFQSIYYHYLDVNGRFTPHFLLQLILLVGKWLFNLLNTAVFIFSPVLVCGFLFSKEQFQKSDKYPYVLLFIFFSYWFLLPFLGQTMLWMTGTVNYFWTSFLVLVFFNIFSKQEIETENSLSKNIFLFIISLLIGWTNESITIGLAVALFFYVLKNYRNLKLSVSFMILGFWLGVAFIIFSPGTFNRVNNEVGISETGVSEVLKKKALDIIAILYLLRYLILTTTILLSVSLFFKKLNFKKIYQDNFLVFWSIIFNILFVFAVGKIEARVLFGIGFFILLFNTYLFADLFEEKYGKFLKIVLSAALLVFFINFVEGFSLLKKYREKYAEMEDRIKTQKQGITFFPKFNDTRFVYNTLSEVSDSKDYHNRVRAFYYGVVEVDILPQDFYQELIPENKICIKENRLLNWNVGEIYKSKKNHFILIEIPQNFDYRHQLKSELFEEGNKIETGGKVKIIPVNTKRFIFVEVQKTPENYKKIIIKTVFQPTEKVFEFYKK